MDSLPPRVVGAPLLEVFKKRMDNHWTIQDGIGILAVGRVLDKKTSKIPSSPITL